MASLPRALFSKQELEDSGTVVIRPAEPKVQGLDARLLKNAGLIAAELTSATFSPRELGYYQCHTWQREMCLVIFGDSHPRDVP